MFTRIGKVSLLTGLIFLEFLLLMVAKRPVLSSDPLTLVKYTASNRQERQSAASSEEISANCRYGVAALSYEGSIERLVAFRAGWYTNFSEWPNESPPHIEFVPVLRVRQLKDSQGNYLPDYYTEISMTQLEAILIAFPGLLWTIGNEVDRGPDPGEIVGGQGDMFPEIYARAYHDLYHFIKQRDPSAQVAVSALVQVTPGRLQYLDRVWQAYYDQFGGNMPVDVWNMHLYVLPEARADGQPNNIASIALGTDPALAIRESGGNPALCPQSGVYCYAEHDDMVEFRQQIIAMRTWMKNHGQQNKPLILSEYSILYPYYQTTSGCQIQDEFGHCFTPERVTNFMLNTFEYLENGATDPALGYPADQNRLVQQWLWFSIYNHGVGGVSSLVAGDMTTLTEPGQAFLDWIEAQDAAFNLVARPGQVATTFLDEPALLSIRIANNGNQATQPFTVKFYQDEAMSQAIGSVVIHSVPGCARESVTAQIAWSGLPAGVHHFWARVDSNNVILESNEQDNGAQGLVIVNPHQLYLPAVR